MINETPSLYFSPATVTAGLLLAALVLYALLGGADYGAGVWDLLASGPRAREQRALIESAIGPIWEANHVWLIYVVVVLFTAFPLAFAALSTALHVPITLLLIGIVLRGTAFTFRHYDRQDDDVQRRWGRVFSVASVVAPVLLGVCVGAIVTGGIRVENRVVTSGFVRPWLGLFPFAVGLFTLALFAYLAAVYLTVEARDPALREDFRRRALGAAVVVGALALGVFLLSGDAAPLVRRGLTARPWSWPLQVATGLCALATLGALWTRRFAPRADPRRPPGNPDPCRVGAGAVPYLIPPDIRIEQAAAPP